MADDRKITIQIDESIKNSISPTQTLDELNKLPNGSYYAKEAGSYAFGETVEDNQMIIFNKKGSVWTVLSKVEFPSNKIDVKQNYDATSTDAISGAGVAEALKGAEGLVVDTELSVTSNNAISNKTVTEKISIYDAYIHEKLVKEQDLEPVYVDVTTLTVSSDTPTNSTTFITPTSITDNVINGDFSMWGTTKMIMIAVQYEDNTYDTLLVSGFTAETCTLVENPIKIITQLQAIHDGVNGQHMTELGYKALGDKLFNTKKEFGYKLSVSKVVDFNGYTKDSNLVNNYYGLLDSNSERVLDFKLLNGFQLSWTTISSISPIYYKNTRPNLIFLSTNVKNRGIEIPLNTEDDGYIEVYAGTDLTTIGKGVLNITNSTGDILYTVDFFGKNTRYILPFSIGNNLQILTKDNVDTKMAVSSISFYKKTEIYNADLWNKDDVVLFLTDSWGEYPITSDTTLIPVQFNGTKRLGKSSMPIRFKELFVQMGGLSENVYLCTRGGFTSAWGKYWIGQLIQIVNPTKVIVNFSINDYNSRTNVDAMTSSAYDFDSSSIFAAKTYANGGVFGSTTKEQYKNNMTAIIDVCKKNGAQAVLLSPPVTASSAQAQGLLEYNRDMYLKGF